MVRDIEYFDDEYLAWLKGLPKVIVNPGAKWRKEQHPKHQKTYIAKAKDETSKDELEFHIYMQYNINMPDKSYSCGISICDVKLARYNGLVHSHNNTESGEKHAFPKIKRGTCHIHQASRLAIVKGKRIDHYAIPTDRYNSVDSALLCLLDDYNITVLRYNDKRRLLL